MGFERSYDYHLIDLARFEIGPDRPKAESLRSAEINSKPSRIYSWLYGVASS